VIALLLLLNLKKQIIHNNSNCMCVLLDRLCCGNFYDCTFITSCLL